MLSRIGEKYSNPTWIALFCFFLICGALPTRAQPEIWSHPGNGGSPNISVLVENKEARLILIGSPFQGGILALDPSDGSERWRTELTERLSRPGRMLSDVALFSTHTGTLVALKTADGYEMWRQASQDPLDFAAASPMVVEGSVYTLSEKGVLSRYSPTGEFLNSHTIDTDWNGRRARFVPMWRDAGGLTFLDQAGRIRSFDVTSLQPIEEKRVVTAVGPGLDLLGSEIQGGVYSASLGWVWTTELSGLLRNSRVDTGQTRWTAPLGDPSEMYSDDGRELSVPILSMPSVAGSPIPAVQKLLVLTRQHATIFNPEDGGVLARHRLPAPAVAPPLFDLSRKTWWVLTATELVGLPWDGQVKSLRLPDGSGWTNPRDAAAGLSGGLPPSDEALRRPYSAALAGNLLVVGTSGGRIFAVPLPQPTPDAPASAAIGEPEDYGWRSW
jgi:hypothetical protein